jgi:hypothetical protein
MEEYLLYRFLKKAISLAVVIMFVFCLFIPLMYLIRKPFLELYPQLNEVFSIFRHQQSIFLVIAIIWVNAISSASISFYCFSSRYFFRKLTYAAWIYVALGMIIPVLKYPTVQYSVLVVFNIVGLFFCFKLASQYWMRLSEKRILTNNKGGL